MCCNDPDNGLFAYVAEQIQIGDQFVELEALHMRAPRFVETDGGFRLAGKNWPVARSQEWHGNWCWNRYWLPIPSAVAFLAWLHGRSLFDCTTGEDRLFNRWRIARPFDADDLELLARELAKPSNHHGRWRRVSWR